MGMGEEAIRVTAPQTHAALGVSGTRGSLAETHTHPRPRSSLAFPGERASGY